MQRLMKWLNDHVGYYTDGGEVAYPKMYSPLIFFIIVLFLIPAIYVGELVKSRRVLLDFFTCPFKRIYANWGNIFKIKYKPKEVK